MSTSEKPKVPMSVTCSENDVNKQMIIWRLRIIVAAVASILCMYIQCYVLCFSPIRFLIPDIFIILYAWFEMYSEWGFADIFANGSGSHRE